MGLQWSSFPSSRPLPEDCSSQDIQCFPSDVSHGRPLEDFGFMSKIAIRESYLLKTFFFFFSPVRSWAAFLKMWHTVDTLYNQILIALFFFVGEGGEVGKERRKEGKGRWCTHTHTQIMIQGQEKTGAITGLRSSFFGNKENPASSQGMSRSMDLTPVWLRGHTVDEQAIISDGLLLLRSRWWGPALMWNNMAACRYLSRKRTGSSPGKWKETNKGNKHILGVYSRPWAGLGTLDVFSKRRPDSVSSSRGPVR